MKNQQIKKYKKTITEKIKDDKDKLNEILKKHLNLLFYVIEIESLVDKIEKIYKKNDTKRKKNIKVNK